MKERAINLRDWEVCAFLDGHKSQIRRVVKPQPRDGFYVASHPEYESFVRSCCPFGKPGDRLWVREAFHEYHWDKPRSVYRADGEPCRVRTQIESYEVGRWTPSIHMPRWASRITLEVKSVRVERLQEISTEDCWANGIPFSPDVDPSHEYRELWESTNGPGSWDENPWVWVVEVKQEENDE